MNTLKTLVGVALFGCFTLVSLHANGQESEKVGLSKRAPWTTSRIKGSPEPPPPFTTERAFPKLKFDRCLDLAKPPGSDRFFIAEQAGKILSFHDRQDAEKAELVIDLAKAIPGVTAIYAITFDPDFQENRFCYVCYIKAANQPDGTHVVRFKVNKSDPPTIDVDSERTLLTWRSGGHNGCCLKFGPDGYLYVSTGDAAPANPPDTMKAGQDVSNLLSTILRIDVDHSDGDRNYRVPEDNPFVDLPNARPEIWAYGFRNPWRMSFDRKTGELWVGDVGWELWEMLNNVQRGGNYGWAVMEGRKLTHPEWPRGPTPILPPTIDHPHSESSSITEGLTYYGSRLKELHGAHIYGDYDTGKIWAFRWRDKQVVDHREIADTTLRIVGFGEDHAGEFYILDHPAGTIQRLIENPRRNETSDFPRKLSETGLFASLAEQLPSPGVIPYSINAEPWADHATARRFVASPGDAPITATDKTYRFPKDSVLAKTLSIELEVGNPASLRRLETQILHFDGVDWRPYSYRWNEQQTDAELVASVGAERKLEIVDPDAPGGIRTQTWRFSGRAECQRCHNRWSGPPLAFNTAQLNKLHDYNGQSASQLATLAHIKLVDKIGDAKKLPRLADPRDAMADLDARARAYLQVNCAHCHRKHAGSAVLSYMHYDLSLAGTNMIDVRPTQGAFGIHAGRVIAPGDPFRSVLLYRMSKLGGGRMPHISSSEVDRAGIALMHEWIVGLSKDLAKDKADDETASKLRRAEMASLMQLRASSKPQEEVVKELLASTSGALMLLRAVDQNSLPPEQRAFAMKNAAKHADGRVRDLFERFLPADERVKRLGNVIQADKILAMTGDIERGKKVVFATAGVQCINCHRIGDRGKELGPALTTIGKKLTRAQLLESLLEPSKRIENKYLTHAIETDDGRLISGLLEKRDDKEAVLKQANGEFARVPIKQIARLVPISRSLMPDLLLRDLTARQVADLLAYLSSLK